jgi:ribosomal protein S18 acetylase RimI-like enzyme
MSLDIREFTAEDYDAALALWKRCEGIGLSDADSPCAIKKLLARNPGMSFVAILDGKLIGTSLCGHDGRRGFLYHVAVDPEQRKSGLGRQLAETSLKVLQAEGIQKCHIMVFHTNEEGKAFWQKTGWIPRPDIDVLSYNIDKGDSQSTC